MHTEKTYNLLPTLEIEVEFAAIQASVHMTSGLSQ